MSNKRRKSTGAKRIKANLLRRMVRGAQKAGTPLPGDGRWLAMHDARVPATDRVGEMRTAVRDLVGPYWGMK